MCKIYSVIHSHYKTLKEFSSSYPFWSLIWINMPNNIILKTPSWPSMYLTAFRLFILMLFKDYKILKLSHNFQSPQRPIMLSTLSLWAGTIISMWAHLCTTEYNTKDFLKSHYKRNQSLFYLQDLWLLNRSPGNKDGSGWDVKDKQGDCSCSLVPRVIWGKELQPPMFSPCSIISV